MDNIQNCDSYILLVIFLNIMVISLAYQPVQNKFLKFHLCGLVVRVSGYISRAPDSIPGATRFSEK
jgi:hypothetical protein